MSFKTCIRNAHEAGEITLEERQGLEKRFDALYRQLQSRGAAKQQLVAEIEAEVAEKKRRALLTETVRKERLAEIYGYRDAKGRQDIAQAVIWQLEHHGQARHGDVESARVAILGQAHAELEELLYEFRKGAFAGDMRRRGGEVAARLDNVVREAAGEATGDAKAKTLADAWLTVAEKMRQRFNAAGGAIGKLEGWFLPQMHDGEALLKEGFEAWKTYIVPRLDRERMLHPLTKTKMTDAELDEALDAVWKKVTTNGWWDREASGAAQGKGALFRQHGDHRFLHFKSADAWLEYSKKFGGGDPFAAMMGHLSTMARDIALMERLGPNPRAMLEYLKQVAIKAGETRETVAQVRARQMARLEELTAQIGRPSKAVEDSRTRIAEILADLEAIRGSDGRVLKRKPDARPEDVQLRFEQLQAALVAEQKVLEKAIKADVGDPDLQGQMRDLLDDIVEPVAGVPFGRRPIERVRSKIETLDAMFASITGASNSPVNSTAANVLSAGRNVITASSLGSAMITAITDAGFQLMARRFAGLPVTSQLRDVVRSIGTGGAREAVRAGLILDSSIHVLQSQAQYVGSVNARTWTGFIADRVLAASGLTAWTQAGKHAFGMAFQATMADMVPHRWADLPEAIQRTLDRHGFDARSWEKVRAAQVYEPTAGGAGLLRPQEIAAAAGDALAERYLAMIQRETKFAVPEPTVRSRVALLGESQPGTARGEVLRAMSQFKSFGVAVVMLQVGRIARELGAGQVWRGASYAGGLLITTTLLGAVSLELKELVAGRDPRDANPLSPRNGAQGSKFWAQALLQGGGMGIWGDLLFSDVNRFGGGMAQTLAGPMADRVDQIRRLTIGNIQQGATGERTNIGREAAQFVRQNTPGSSLWYLRLAWERIAMDQLQHLADPEASAAFRRRRQQRLRDYGNEFWWSPGETAPRRGPDLSHMLGR